jgi:large subunit ribosomal protein L10
MANKDTLVAKQSRVQELTKLINDSVSCVLVDYKGITVEEDTKLRKELREAGVNYFVEKNTLLLRAFQNCGIEGLDDVFNKNTAIAISNDNQTISANILGKFAENSNSTFTLKAGYIDGEVYNSADIIKISKIPSKDVLLAQLVSSLQNPIQKLAVTITAVAEQKSNEN